MSLKAYQQEVDEFVQQFEVPYWDPLAMITRLAEEVGETAREVNHLFGPKKKKSSEQAGSLDGEIADVLFTLICLANSQNIDLDEAFGRMMDKVTGRDKERFARRGNFQPEASEVPEKPVSRKW